jgi:hypothetical protein
MLDDTHVLPYLSLVVALVVPFILRFFNSNDADIKKISKDTAEIREKVVILEQKVKGDITLLSTMRENDVEMLKNFMEKFTPRFEFDEFAARSRANQDGLRVSQEGLSARVDYLASLIKNH